MWKYFLLSIMIGSMAVPARMARAKNPKEGLKKALYYMLAFNAFWYFVVLYIYGRI